MSQKEDSPASEGNCKDCKHRGAMLRDVKVYCNQIKKLVPVQRCEHYEKDDGVAEMLAQKSPTELEAEEIREQTETIENESLNKILEFFTSDGDWEKLRRLLCKDILSTTVLLNYIEYNKNAKKKFMNALIAMAQKELTNADRRT